VEVGRRYPWDRAWRKKYQGKYMAQRQGGGGGRGGVRGQARGGLQPAGLCKWRHGLLIRKYEASHENKGGAATLLLLLLCMSTLQPLCWCWLPTPDLLN
jgi:hypothetical protein